MFKVYQKYLINNFLIKFLYICLIFTSLTFILNILEEISFVKNLNINVWYPYFLTLLNLPITMFEINGSKFSGKKLDPIIKGTIGTIPIPKIFQTSLLLA